MVIGEELAVALPQLPEQAGGAVDVCEEKGDGAARQLRQHSRCGGRSV
jgi:hypothetical protein